MPTCRSRRAWIIAELPTAWSACPSVLVSRLQAPLQGVARLDAVLTLSFEPGQERRLHDVPFDSATGEVMFAPPLAAVRQQPTHD